MFLLLKKKKKILKIIPKTLILCFVLATVDEGLCARRTKQKCVSFPPILRKDAFRSRWVGHVLHAVCAEITLILVYSESCVVIS